MLARARPPESRVAPYCVFCVLLRQEILKNEAPIVMSPGKSNLRQVAARVKIPPAPGEVYILAGGLSTRMGRDKSRMRLGGKTLLQHVEDAARAVDWPVQVIRRDLVPRCGPLGGIYTAFQTSGADTLLFLACDMPFVSGGFLQHFVKQLERGTEAVFAGESGRAGFPILLRRSVVGRIERQLELRRFALGGLAGVCGAKRVSIPARDSWMFLNINSPEEWDLARRLACERPCKPASCVDGDAS